MVAPPQLMLLGYTWGTNPRKYLKVVISNTIILLSPEPAEEWDKREVLVRWEPEKGREKI